MYSNAKKKVNEDSRLNIAWEAVHSLLLAAGAVLSNTILASVLLLLAHFPKLLPSFLARLKCVCLTQPLDGVFPFHLFIYLLFVLLSFAICEASSTSLSQCE